MIRIERVHLPSGLRALAHRDVNGDLVIYVSAELDARRQRAAVMAAVRASRRAGWRVVLPGLLVGIAAARMLLRGLPHSMRTQLAAWGAVAAGVAGVAAIAALVLVTGQPPHGQTAETQPRPGGVSVPVAGGSAGPGGTRSAPARPGGQVTPPGTGAPGPGSPVSGSSGPSSPPAGGPSSPPSPTPSSPGTSSSPRPPAPTPTPTSRPTPTPTQPSPSPSPTPSPPKKGKPGTCLIVLGIKVCVPLNLSVSLHL